MRHSGFVACGAVVVWMTSVAAAPNPADAGEAASSATRKWRRGRGATSTRARPARRIPRDCRRCGPGVAEQAATRSTGCARPGRLDPDALDWSARRPTAPRTALLVHRLRGGRAEAERSGKPIVLSLAGPLDEQLSCANSRYFGWCCTAIRRSPVAAEHAVLYWTSERPVPRDGGLRRRRGGRHGDRQQHPLPARPARRLVDAMPGCTRRSGSSLLQRRGAGKAVVVAERPRLRRQARDDHARRERQVLRIWWPSSSSAVGAGAPARAGRALPEPAAPGGDRDRRRGGRAGGVQVVAKRGPHRRGLSPLPRRSSPAIDALVSAALDRQLSPESRRLVCRGRRTRG